MTQQVHYRSLDHPLTSTMDLSNHECIHIMPRFLSTCRQSLMYSHHTKIAILAIVPRLLFRQSLMYSHHNKISIMYSHDTKIALYTIITKLQFGQLLMYSHDTKIIIHAIINVFIAYQDRYSGNH